MYYGVMHPVSPGKLEAIVSNIDAVTLGFTYDGSLLTYTTWSGAVSGTVGLDYDDDLRVTTDVVSGDAVSYSYGDTDGLLTQAGALSIALDADTALLTGTSIGTLSDTVVYDPFAEPVSYTVTSGGGATELYDMTLAYDALGRIELKTEVLGGATTVGYAYTYDDAGRLSEVRSGTGACGQVSCTLVESYTYDANGNRLSVTDAGGATTSASYDAQDPTEPRPTRTPTRASSRPRPAARAPPPTTTTCSATSARSCSPPAPSSNTSSTA